MRPHTRIPKRAAAAVNRLRSGRARAALVLGVLTMAAAGTVAALAGPAAASTAEPGAAAATDSQTFLCTGNQQTYTVPAGVTSVTYQASGANGAFPSTFPSPGGKGAKITGSIPVTPGEVLTIDVGCTNHGGYGWATGGPGGTGFLSGGANGGGATGIYSDSSSDPLVVAAGGGGAGGNGFLVPNFGNYSGGVGGAGGGVGGSTCGPGGNGNGPDAGAGGGVGEVDACDDSGTEFAGGSGLAELSGGGGGGGGGYTDGEGGSGGGSGSAGFGAGGGGGGAGGSSAVSSSVTAQGDPNPAESNGYVKLTGVLPANPNLTITAEDQTMTYGGQVPSLTASYSGFVNGDTPASLSGALSCNAYAPSDTAYSSPLSLSGSTPAGTYVIHCSGQTSGYYNVAYADGTLTIGKALATITATSPSMTYGDTTIPGVSSAVSDLQNGETSVSFTTSPTCVVRNSADTADLTVSSSTPAGSYKTRCSGAVATNYNFTYVDGTFTIAQAPLTVTPDPKTIPYGQTPAYTAPVTGFVNGETAATAAGYVAPTCSAGAGPFTVPGSPYTISCAGGSANNYTFDDSATAALTVTKASLAVTAPSPSMIYGDTTLPSLAPAGTGVTGLQNGDTFSGLGGSCSPLTSGAAFTLSSSTNAGTYTVRCSGVSAANYNVTYTDGLLTVNQAPLTVTADNKGPVQYSDPMPALTATLSGFRNGQTLATSGVTGLPSCSTTAGMTTATVGQGSSYPITCTVGSLAAPNYTFPAANFNNGSLTVTQETAAIQYTGGTSVQLPTGGGSGTLPLAATVWDSAASGYPSWGATDGDGLTSDTPGDVTKMFVQWEIWPAGSCLSGTPSTIVGPVKVTQTSAGIGTAAGSFAQSADGSFCVVAQVVGQAQNSPNPYYTANDAQVAGTAFYTAGNQKATGGGWIPDSGSTTGKSTFGFTAGYNNNGSPKGQMVFVWRGTYNNTPADFIIKSNALTALSFTKNSSSSYSATLQGKCSYTIVSQLTGSQLYGEGNDTFSATVTDGDNGASQQASSADSVSLTTFQSGNQKLHPITTTTLGGGNIFVHN